EEARAGAPEEESVAAMETEAATMDEDDMETVTGTAVSDGEVEEEYDGGLRAELESRILELTKERDEANDQLLRSRAEFENYRKRTLREGERLRKTAAEKLIRDLLPVADNLERALAHVEDRS